MPLRQDGLALVVRARCAEPGVAAGVGAQHAEGRERAHRHPRLLRPHTSGAGERDEGDRRPARHVARVPARPRRRDGGGRSVGLRVPPPPHHGADGEHRGFRRGLHRPGREDHPARRGAGQARLPARAEPGPAGDPAEPARAPRPARLQRRDDIEPHVGAPGTHVDRGPVRAAGCGLGAPRVRERAIHRAEHDRHGAAAPRPAHPRRPVASCGIDYPGNRIHAPNENIRLDYFRLGVLHTAELITELGA